MYRHIRRRIATPMYLFAKSGDHFLSSDTGHLHEGGTLLKTGVTSQFDSHMMYYTVKQYTIHSRNPIHKQTPFSVRING